MVRIPGTTFSDSDAPAPISNAHRVLAEEVGQLTDQLFRMCEAAARYHASFPTGMWPDDVWEWWKEHREDYLNAKEERRKAARVAALAKLTDEDKEVLGLNKE